MYLPHYGLCERTGFSIFKYYIFFFFYFYELVNKQKGSILPPGVCLNRYKANIGDLLPHAVMECLLTSIIHWLIPLMELCDPSFTHRNAHTVDLKMVQALNVHAVTCFLHPLFNSKVVNSHFTLGYQMGTFLCPDVADACYILCAWIGILHIS